MWTEILTLILNTSEVFLLLSLWVEILTREPCHCVVCHVCLTFTATFKRTLSPSCVPFAGTLSNCPGDGPYCCWHPSCSFPTPASAGVWPSSAGGSCPWWWPQLFGTSSPRHSSTSRTSAVSVLNLRPQTLQRRSSPPKSPAGAPASTGTATTSRDIPSSCATLLFSSWRKQLPWRPWRPPVCLRCPGWFWTCSTWPSIWSLSCGCGCLPVPLFTFMIKPKSG